MLQGLMPMSERLQKKGINQLGKPSRLRATYLRWYPIWGGGLTRLDTPEGIFKCCKWWRIFKTQMEMLFAKLPKIFNL